jgi:hypothetical protein
MFNHYVCNIVAREVFNIKLVKQKVGQYELHTKLVPATHHDFLQGSNHSHCDSEVLCQLRI